MGGCCHMGILCGELKACHVKIIGYEDFLICSFNSIRDYTPMDGYESLCL